MKTLLVLSVLPYPKDVGKRIMLGGICDYLQQNPNVRTICTASFVGGSEADSVDWVVALPKPSTLRKIWNLLWFSAVRRSKSLQESLFWNPAAKRRLDTLIELYKPEVIVYDTLRTGQYRQATRSGVEIIYMDDLFSERYRKMLAAIEQNSLRGLNAIGNFGDNLPHAVLRLYHKWPGLQRTLLRIEQKLITSSENRAPHDFDQALLVSCVEQELLHERTNAANIVAIPPRTEAAGSNRRTWSGQPEFLFLGSLNLAHNAVSITRFLANSMDLLLQKEPDLRIVIAGRGADTDLIAVANRYPGRVALRGFVSDLDPLLLRACAMIAPLEFGSGVKLKSIDALRCGTPLVATTFGVEGIDASRTQGIFLHDENAAFLQSMLALLDPELNQVASQSNLRLYQSVYSSSAVDKIYGKIFLSQALQSRDLGSHHAA